MTSIEYYNQGEKYLARYRETSFAEYLQLALLFYNKAVELQPDNTEAIDKRAIAGGFLDAHDDYLADMQFLTRIFDTKINSDKAHLHFNVARAFKDNFNAKNHMEKAKFHYVEAIKLGYDASKAYFDLAEAYHRFPLNDQESALDYYSKAIEASPRIYSYYLGRGQCYSLFEKHEKAIADFSKGIEISTNDWRLYNWRGEEYIRLREWDKAIKDYQQCRILQPQESDPIIALLQNITGGCYFEFHFAKGMSEQQHWHPDSYFISDSIFDFFTEVFSKTNSSFNYYGPNYYNNNDLKDVEVELKILLGNIEMINDYQNFLECMINCKYIGTLIRFFNNFEDNWVTILGNFKDITNQLINLTSEAIAKDYKLYLNGI